MQKSKVWSRRGLQPRAPYLNPRTLEPYSRRALGVEREGELVGFGRYFGAVVGREGGSPRPQLAPAPDDGSVGAVVRPGYLADAAACIDLDRGVLATVRDVEEKAPPADGIARVGADAVAHAEALLDHFIGGYEEANTVNRRQWDGRSGSRRLRAADGRKPALRLSNRRGVVPANGTLGQRAESTRVRFGVIVDEVERVTQISEPFRPQRP